MRLPNEIVSSVLAATDAFIGGNALNLLVCGVVIGSAATFLVDGPVRSTFGELWASMAAGSTFALVVVLLVGFASYFATVFGGFGFAPQNPWAAWVSVLVCDATGPVFAGIAHTVSTRAGSVRPDSASSLSAPDAS